MNKITVVTEIERASYGNVKLKETSTNATNLQLYTEATNSGLVDNQLKKRVRKRRITAGEYMVTSRRMMKG